MSRTSSALAVGVRGRGRRRGATTHAHVETTTIDQPPRPRRHLSQPAAGHHHFSAGLYVHASPADISLAVKFAKMTNTASVRHSIVGVVVIASSSWPCKNGLGYNIV